MLLLRLDQGTGLKRKIDAERLVRWAYRDELPKGYKDGVRGHAPQISAMFRYAALGGPVDNWAEEPGFPVAMGTQPHPDAIAVHNAIVELAGVKIAHTGAHALLGDLVRYMGEEERFAAANLTAQPAGLIAHHARMNNRPFWDMDYRVIRVTGRDRKSLLRKGRGRKHVRTQGELRLDPSAFEILSARFEYFAWHAGLTELAHTLTDLIEHEAMPPMAPQQPWLHPEECGRVLQAEAFAMDARALATGRLSVLPKLPLVPQRKRVLPQEPAASHGPVRHIRLVEET